MSIRVTRSLLGILAASAALVGFWAALAPHDFYLTFPGLGMHWLMMLGPYNEHLVRDVGGLYLALLVLSLGAIARAYDDFLVRLTGGAWAAFSAPHLAFHLAHLSHDSTRDAVLNVITLGGTLLLALAVLLAPRPRRAR